MGMSVGAAGKSGGRRKRGVPRYGAMAEINMTPFIDVVLVLLIIFMVAAPLLVTGVPIDLPKTPVDAQPIDAKALTVSMKDNGELYIGDDLVTVDAVVSMLQERTNNDHDKRIQFRGARTLPYGQVMDVIARIKDGGFDKFALVIEHGDH